MQTVGIEGGNEQKNHVVKNVASLGIGSRGKFVSQFNGFLAGADFGRMNIQTAHHDGFGLIDEGSGLLLGQIIWVSDLLLNPAVMIQILDVLGRRDDGQKEGFAQSRFSQFLNRNSVGFSIQHPEIIEDLIIIDEPPVGAHAETECFFGRGQRLACNRPG